MSQITVASVIAILITAGVGETPIFAGNFVGNVNAQNPEMASDNSTMMSGNTTSGNDTSMMSGNTTSGNDTSMMSGTISGKGRG